MPKRGPAWRPRYKRAILGIVPGVLILASASGGGSDVAFVPLVFLHAISALAAFGSIGFAGTYASRAAHLQGFAAAAPPPGDPAAPGAPAGHAAASPSPAGSTGELDPEVEELLRYFQRPARFWKAILLVPVFGILALVVQPNGKGLDQVWTVAALLVWLLAVLVAAGVVVPALNQMKSMLGQARAPGGGPARAAAAGQ
ncbi:MAG: hypothetical protein ACRDZX_06575, partial [Acidimicrobiales bacterium]